MGNGYQGMSDHDLMVRMATQMDELVVPEIKLLRAEDDIIHGRITGEAKSLRQDINKVDDKVGKIKIWATASAAIGGVFGAMGAWLTTKGG